MVLFNLKKYLLNCKYEFIYTSELHGMKTTRETMKRNTGTKAHKRR